MIRTSWTISDRINTWSAFCTIVKLLLYPRVEVIGGPITLAELDP